MIKPELKNLYELGIKGFIIRSNTNYVKGGEKNTIFFKLRENRWDDKTLHKLVTTGKEFTR